MRVDRGIAPGDVVGTRYDPLLAKLIASGHNRREALGTLTRMVDGTSVIGVTNNRGFLSWLATDREVRSGHMWTTFIDERWPEIAAAADETPDEAWSAAAAALATGDRLESRRRGLSAKFFNQPIA